MPRQKITNPTQRFYVNKVFVNKYTKEVYTEPVEVKGEIHFVQWMPIGLIQNPESKTNVIAYNLLNGNKLGEYTSTRRALEAIKTVQWQLWENIVRGDYKNDSINILTAHKLYEMKKGKVMFNDRIRESGI